MADYYTSRFDNFTRLDRIIVSSKRYCSEYTTKCSYVITGEARQEEYNYFLIYSSYFACPNFLYPVSRGLLNNKR